MNHDIHHPYSKRYCPLLLLLLLCQPLHSTPTTPEMQPTHFLQKAQQHIMRAIPTSYLSWLKIAGSIGLSTLIVYLYLTFRNSPYTPQHQYNTTTEHLHYYVEQNALLPIQPHSSNKASSLPIPITLEAKKIQTSQHKTISLPSLQQLLKEKNIDTTPHLPLFKPITEQQHQHEINQYQQKQHQHILKTYCDRCHCEISPPSSPTMADMVSFWRCTKTYTDKNEPSQTLDICKMCVSNLKQAKCPGPCNAPFFQYNQKHPYCDTCHKQGIYKHEKATLLQHINLPPKQPQLVIVRTTLKNPQKKQQLLRQATSFKALFVTPQALHHSFDLLKAAIDSMPAFPNHKDIKHIKETLESIKQHGHPTPNKLIIIPYHDYQWHRPKQPPRKINHQTQKRTLHITHECIMLIQKPQHKQDPLTIHTIISPAKVNSKPWVRVKTI